MKTKRFTMTCCVVLLGLLSAVTLAFGQNDRATITGTVTDSTGAIIAGVHILAVATDSGVSYSGISNDSGVYVIPGLPVGAYTLKVTQPGFRDYLRTDLNLIATQVLQLDVHMSVGASTETVVITGGVPLLETETTSVSMTMEQEALRDLPLDATGGRDAMNLMLATTPLVTSPQGGQGTQSTQNWNNFAGQENMTNSVYVDGLESTSGYQGQIATPGLDALSEVQLITSPADAQFGTPGGVELFQIKSGTDKLHGSAFEILQNEDLNANSWSNNYFLAQCAPSDTQCRADNSRGLDRFNDFGASAGGPIWKKHTFIFGDFEKYIYKDYQLNPNSTTVPTPQMLTGDFSQLLTGGANQGIIPGPNGGPWINPCTGQPYLYGQIFDPQTQTVVNGVTCATPFTGNIIPSGRLSNASKQYNALFAKDMPPTISTRIVNNFPTYVSNNPSLNKFTLDLKLDHTFSEKHHLSAGLNHVSWNTLVTECGPSYTINPNSPLNCNEPQFAPNDLYRIVDDYAFRPNLLNTFGVGFADSRTHYAPVDAGVTPSTYGLNSYPQSQYFPGLIFDNYSGNVANGVIETSPGDYGYASYNSNAFQYQDTVQWTIGRHSIKFGGTLKAQQLNSKWGGNISTINFDSITGGPTDPGLTPFVGFAFANESLGDVNSSVTIVNNTAYPRQKLYGLFVQDDLKATRKLTLNLGLRWDITGRDHEINGNLQNFDITATNPAWAPYTGAWVFSNNSGTSFETSEDYHQFGPHIGAAYRVTDKLVGRASYGVFYVPDLLMNASNGGVGQGYPALQTELAFPTNQVTNNAPGSVAFNWDNTYPGQNSLSPQNSTATTIPGGDLLMYTHPDYLHLGYTQNWYAGAEYAISDRMSLNLAYVANRGRNLHDPARSFHRNDPSFSVYQPLLLSGNEYNSISNAADAAATGVPYPYAGFVGPAYAAISPFPQVTATGSQMEVTGDPDDAAVSAFDSFVVEAKGRDYHGLFIDFSYTLSKMTGSYQGLEGWANNWSDPAQSEFDWQDEKHWVQSFDQRHLAKGYVTYSLPFGKGKEFLSTSSKIIDTAVGGWRVGYYGSYGSGTPMGAVMSTFQTPGYYCCNDRADLVPGVTARDVSNHFSGHLDLDNVNDPSNTDFNTNLFTATTATAPFGNTPRNWNHWRWNPGVAHENMSLLKNFNAGEGIHLIIGAQFFDVFNRHYYGAPGTSMGSYNFGQVTSVSGYRYGQLSGRIEW